MDSVKHRFSLPSDATAAGRARRALDSFEDLLESHALDAYLLATELVAISLDSRPAGRSAAIVLGVEISQAEIRIEVSDDGTVADRRSVLSNGPTDSATLIDEIADSWGLGDDDGHSMWCTLKRASAGVRG